MILFDNRQIHAEHCISHTASTGRARAGHEPGVNVNMGRDSENTERVHYGHKQDAGCREDVGCVWGMRERRERHMQLEDA